MLFRNQVAISVSNGPGAALLAALGEPNRLRIFELLQICPLPVSKIVDRLALSQPLVSKHLRVLRGVGLVEAKPLGQQRIYNLRAEPLKELDDWLETYRHIWDKRFDQLGVVLKQLNAEGAKHGQNNTKN